MKVRPDFSNYLAHFTKDQQDHTAKEVLISILTEQRIKASSMPWTNVRAVCFTECPWTSLIEHTHQYSPFGIGFSKSLVFSRNGGPVYYMRPDHFNEQMENNQFAEHVLPFITPFSPSYRPKKLKDIFPTTVDYTHEREWRIPHDFPFDYKNIEFIVLGNYQDMAEFPENLKNAIGPEKFILMDNYMQIEKLWPVHIL